MFNSIRTVQMKAINEMALKLKSRNATVVETSTTEFTNNMVIDVVSAHSADFNSEDMKSIHKVSMDSRIAVASVNIQSLDDCIIIRTRYSFSLRDYSQSELQTISDQEQWNQDMINELEQEAIENDIKENTVEKHIEIHAAIDDCENQDIHDFDFNQDSHEFTQGITKSQQSEIDSLDEMLRIDSTLEQKDIMEILRKKIDIIENNNHVIDMSCS